MSSTPDIDGSLYATHQKIYPREVAGRFNRLRVMAVWTLLGLFYVLPWIRWNDHQAVLFDLPARRFYVFGLTLFPQDFYLLTWLLIIAAVSLFFVTALAGRLWCGYACPQTVWTEIFVWMERLAEGKRPQRMKLDQSPWNFNRLARKAAKQALWISFALFTGFTFVGYFTAIDTLTQEVRTLSLGAWEAFWCLFYGFATYGNAGYMREQVCKYMCPYARFQGTMFDRNTLIITYDAQRGESRGARARNSDYKAKGLGDCIDCTLCVQACPTGIDIRNGLQLECIACAACIDACDSVMDKMGYPQGLVRYSTQTAIEGTRTRLLRPRTLIYAGALLVLIIGFGIAVANRQILQLDVLRDRNALYRTTDAGTIENVYTIRVINKDMQPHRVRFSVRQLPESKIELAQGEYVVEPASVLSTPLRISVPEGTIRGGRDIVLVAEAEGTLHTQSTARFLAPP